MDDCTPPSERVSGVVPARRTGGMASGKVYQLLGIAGRTEVPHALPEVRRGLSDLLGRDLANGEFPMTKRS